MWAVLTILVIHLACMLHLDAPFLVCVASSVIPGMIYAYSQKTKASYDAICSEMDNLKADCHAEMEFKTGEVEGMVREKARLQNDVEALQQRLKSMFELNAKLQNDVNRHLSAISALHREVRHYEQQGFHRFAQANALPVTSFSTRQGGMFSSSPAGQ